MADRLYRDALATALGAFDGIAVKGTTATGPDALGIANGSLATLLAATERSQAG